jgi:hypothetical protein
MSLPPSCLRCSRGIEGDGEGCLVEGKPFHKACFACSDCSASLVGEEEFYVSGTGEALCPTHFHIRSGAPVCRGCKKPVTGAHVELPGAVLHEGCARCAACATSLLGRALVPHGERILCNTCHHIEYGFKCAGCGKNILPAAENPDEDPECIQVEGRYFHVGCFSCAKCACALTLEYCAHGGRFLCKACGAEHMAPEGEGQARPSDGDDLFGTFSNVSGVSGSLKTPTFGIYDTPHQRVDGAGDGGDEAKTMRPRSIAMSFSRRAQQEHAPPLGIYEGEQVGIYEGERGSIAEYDYASGKEGERRDRSASVDSGGYTTCKREDLLPPHGADAFNSDEEEYSVPNSQ